MTGSTPKSRVITCDSKRGLDTRVSLKGALATMGFKGGTRGTTEWNQWMENEKQELALIMVKYGIEWKQLGTHNKHLSVLDYEKQELLHSKDKLQEDHQLLNNEFLQMQEIQKMVQQNICRYDYPEWTLPEPSGFMSAKTFYESKAFPLVAKFKDAFKKIAAQLTVLEEKIKSLTEDVIWYKAKKLVEKLFEKDKRIEKLQEKADDLERVKRHAGADQVDKIIEIERQRDGFYSFNRNQEDKHR